MRALTQHLLRNSVLALGAIAWALPSHAQTPLLAGDVAVIGWRDAGGGTPAFTVVLLADADAGSEIYFSNSGITGSAFRNTQGATDGDGDEQLIKLTLTAPAAAGKIMTSNVAGAGFTWTSSGAIPGTTTGTFGNLLLSATGDQVIAFQHSTGTNPLNTATQTMLYMLDDTGAYENATDIHTGAIPPGLS